MPRERKPDDEIGIRNLVIIGGIGFIAYLIHHIIT
jgi:hypothetical protein